VKETKDYGFKKQIDEDRSVVGVPPAIGNDYDGIYWKFTNKGVDTYVALSNKALDAMIEIRDLVKTDQLQDHLVDEIRSHLKLKLRTP
jgi:hypothetical protein